MVTFSDAILIHRDNEKPARQEKVHAFEAKGRPITNEEVSPASHILSHLIEQS